MTNKNKKIKKFEQVFLYVLSKETYQLYKKEILKL